MEKPRLIGLAGPAGSGKDSVAEVLVKHHGYTSISFAAPLKKMLEVLGVDMTDRSKKELPHPVFGKSPRQMAQTLGTEWMRNCVNVDGWTLLLEHTLARYSTTSFVITDVRFPNEVALVKRRFGEMWFIARPGVAPVARHSSESSVRIIDCDRSFRNDGTLRDLPAKVAAFFGEEE